MSGNVEKRFKNPKNLKIFRKRPNASNCFRMHPNASQWVRMDPKASKSSRKPQKTCENFEKLRKNFEKLREKFYKNFFHGVVLFRRWKFRWSEAQANFSGRRTVVGGARVVSGAEKKSI